MNPKDPPRTWVYPPTATLWPEIKKDFIITTQPPPSGKSYVIGTKSPVSLPNYIGFQDKNKTFIYAFAPCSDEMYNNPTSYYLYQV